MKLVVSEERKARLPEREARLDKRPRKRSSQYGKTKKRKTFDAVADLPASVLQHPSFKRIVRSICPFSGLSQAGLEQHVAGVLAMVDEADRRERAA